MDDQALHILVVDDDSTELLLLKAALNDVRTTKFVLTGVKRLDEALRCLHDKHFDAVLLHLGLPDSQGLETFTRMQREYPAIPILIFSGRSDEDLAIEAVQAGAQDLVAKGDYKGILLARSIRYAIERKSSEQRLTASEASYRRLFESAHDGIFILEAETGKITDANPYIEELLGYTITEFIGKRLWEIAPFRDKAANQAAFRTLQEKGYIRYDDLPLMTKDGKWADVEFISNVYAVGNQQVIQCNIRDISERKLAEAAEQKSKRFLQSTLDALSSHLAVLDEDGMIIAVNEAWQRFADENDGDNISCGVGANYIAVCEQATGAWGEEAPQVAKVIRQVLAGREEKFELEYPCDAPDEQRWFNLRITRFNTETPVRVVVAHENITERKQAEQEKTRLSLELQQQRQRLDDILANVPAIVWEAKAGPNSLQTLDYVSKYAETMLGYSLQEWLATPDFWQSIIHPDDKESSAQKTASEFTSGHGGSNESRLIANDGRTVWIESHTEFIHDPQGNIIGVRGISTDITERKMADQALLQSEARFRTAISEAPVPIMLHREDGQVLQISKGWTEYSGYAIEDIPTIRDWTERSCGEESAGAYEYIQTLYDARETSSGGEWTITAKNGEKRIWDFITTPLGTFGDDLRVVINTAFDITERKQAEQELRESNEKFQLLANHITDVFWIRSADMSKQIYLSPAFERMWGIPAEAQHTDPHIWSDFVVPEDHDRVVKEFSSLRYDTPSVSVEYRIRRGDGEVRWVHSRGYQVRNDAGELIYLAGIVSDITERKDAALGLASLAAIVESSSDAIFSKTLDGVITSWNTGAEELYGYSPDEAIGCSVYMMVAPHHVTEEAQLLERIARGERVANFETVCMCKDDRQIDVSLTLSPIKNSDGVVIGTSAISRDITERKLAQEQQARLAIHIEQQRQRLDNIMTSVPGVVWEAWGQPDAATQHIDFVSDYVETMLGYSATEWLSTPNFWLTVVHPDDKELAAREVAAIFAGGHTGTSQFRWMTKDGRVIWVESHSVAVCDEAGKPVGMRGVTMDISERKLAEIERDRFFTLSLDMLAIIDSDGYFKRLNPAFEATLGFSNAELMAVPFLEFVHPDDIAETLVHLERGIQADQENRYRCRDGSYKWLLWKSVPFEDLWYCVAHDVTEFRQTERTIRESEEYFRFLNDLSEATRLLADPEQIMAVMTRMLGEHLNVSRCVYADVESNGKAFTIVHDYTDDCASTVGKYQLSSFGPRVVATLSSGTTLIIRNVEAELLPDDGAESFNAIGIQAAIVCPLVKEGVLHAMMAVHQATPRDWQPREITLVQDVVERCWATIERRAAEEKIYQLNADLEHRVIERTTQLEAANTDLQAAREIADTANLAKSEFLSRMSHELRTPLNAILGFGQILDKEELGPLSKESIGYILKGGRHLLDLINEVLDIARVEAGRVELSLEPIALDDIVPDACALVRPLAVERNIRLEENSSELRGSHILADRQRLKQVMFNLLANAIKYNREGGRVQVVCEPKPDGWTAIAIHDTGPGIASQDLPKLFTPFERLDANSSEVEGTGLGLVLSQRLVTAMGGTLSVESTLGRGSIFTIELSQAASPHEQLANLPERAFPLKTSQEIEHSYSLLCIEDNSSNLRLIEAILRERPEITLLSAMQGGVGLDLARQHEPDLILLDLNLPDIQGREVLARLQQSALTRDIPVVVISADATPKQIERLLAAGAKAYLTKPLDVEQFLQTMDEFLHATPVIATQTGNIVSNDEENL